ncbi:MAG TPA: hypothetical protein EYN89_11945, partial [Flavobacteriales bacterium]|nr:hypothetical protein [Flavobacteriales bacterium]
YIRNYAAFAFPVMFIAFVGVYSKSIDKIMLQYFLGSYEVGVYAIPERMTRFLLIIPATISAMIFAVFAGLHMQKDNRRIEAITNKSVRYISMFLLPTIIFLYIFSESVFTFLFGMDAIASINAARILLVACYVNSLRLVYTSQIVSGGYLKTGLFLNLQILVTNTVLNLIFIPEEIWGYTMLGLGVEGAALTYLLSLLLNTIIMLYSIKIITNTSLFVNLWKHFLSGFIVAFLFMNLGTYLQEFPLILFSPFLVFGLYLLIIYFLGEIKRSDVDFFADLLNFKAMSKYIRDELAPGRTR